MAGRPARCCLSSSSCASLSIYPARILIYSPLGELRRRSKATQQNVRSTLVLRVSQDAAVSASTTIFALSACVCVCVGPISSRPLAFPLLRYYSPAQANERAFASNRLCARASKKSKERLLSLARTARMCRRDADCSVIIKSAFEFACEARYRGTLFLFLLPSR